MLWNDVLHAALCHMWPVIHLLWAQSSRTLACLSHRLAKELFFVKWKCPAGCDAQFISSSPGCCDEWHGCSPPLHARLQSQPRSFSCVNRAVMWNKMFLGHNGMKKVIKSQNGTIIMHQMYIDNRWRKSILIAMIVFYIEVFCAVWRRYHILLQLWRLGRSSHPMERHL